MSYPVSTTGRILRIRQLCRRLRMLLVVFFVCGAVSGGIFAWYCVEDVYQADALLLLQPAPGYDSQSKLDIPLLDLKKKFSEKLNRHCLKNGVTSSFTGHKVSNTIIFNIVIRSSNYHSTADALKKCAVFFNEALPDNLSGSWKMEFEVVAGPFRYNVLFTQKIFGIMLWALIGAAGADILFILLALFLENPMRDLKAFEKEIDLPVLGVLPDIRKHRKSGNTLNSDRYFARAINSLILNVQHQKTLTFHNRAFVLMFCPLSGGEGGSTVAAHVANALAENGMKVMLLDGDFRHRKPRNGIYSRSGSDCSKVCVDQLYDLAASENPAGMLTKKSESYLQSLSDKYDYIIIDAPAVHGSTDSIIISRLADSSMIVCDYRRCPLYKLKVVLWRLKKASGKVCGAVINFYPHMRRHEQYTSYQYFYRSYEDDLQKK